MEACSWQYSVCLASRESRRLNNSMHAVSVFVLDVIASVLLSTGTSLELHTVCLHLAITRFQYQSSLWRTFFTKCSMLPILYAYLYAGIWDRRTYLFTSLPFLAASIVCDPCMFLKQRSPGCYYELFISGLGANSQPPNDSDGCRPCTEQIRMSECTSLRFTVPH